MPDVFMPIPGFDLSKPNVQLEEDPLLRRSDVPDPADIDLPAPEAPDPGTETPEGLTTDPERSVEETKGDREIPSHVQEFFDAEDPVEFILRTNENYRRRKAIRHLEEESEDLGLLADGASRNRRADAVKSMLRERTRAEQSRNAIGQDSPIKLTEIGLTEDEKKEKSEEGLDKAQQKGEILRLEQEADRKISKWYAEGIKKTFGVDMPGLSEADIKRRDEVRRGAIKRGEERDRRRETIYRELTPHFQKLVKRMQQAVDNPSQYGPQVTEMTHYLHAFTGSAADMGFGISKGVIIAGELLYDLAYVADHNRTPFAFALGFGPDQPSTGENRAVVDEFQKWFRDGLKVDDFLTHSQWFLTDLAQAGGSMSVFLMGGMIGQAIANSARAGGAIAGVMGGLVEGSHLVDQYEKADDYDHSMWKKYMSFLGGLGVGATEALTISRMLARANQITGGSVMRTLKSQAEASLAAAFDNALQETGQGALSDIVAKAVFDPHRSLDMMQYMREGLAGGVSGALLQIMLGGAGFRRQVDAEQSQIDQEEQQRQALVELEREILQSDFDELQSRFDNQFDAAAESGGLGLEERFDALPETERENIRDAIDGVNEGRETPLTEDERNQLLEAEIEASENFVPAEVKIVEAVVPQVAAEAVPAAQDPLSGQSVEMVDSQPVKKLDDGSAGLHMFDPTTITADPNRFQFREGGDEFGVTGVLANVTQWRTERANTVIVWRDNKGKDFIVDGHQRLGLAKKLLAEGKETQIQIPGVLYRQEDGVTPSEAMDIASLKNISEGTASPIDAAKVIRHVGPKALEDLPISRDAVRSAVDLSKLDNEAWRMVINDVVSPQFAKFVGRYINIDDAQVQMAAMTALARAKPANQDEAAILVRRVAESELVAAADTSQESMFEELDNPESTVMEEVRIVSRAAQIVARDKRLFSRVVREAERLEEAGSEINRVAAQDVISTADRLKTEIEKLAFRAGDVRDALLGLARELHDGSIKLGEAAETFVSEIRRGEEEAGDTGAETGRTGRDDGPAGEVPATLYQRVAEERGADDRPQLVIPGAEQAGQGEQAQRKADEPLKPKKEQKPTDFGLFGDDAAQSDFDFRRVRQAEDMGFDTSQVLYHGTGREFTEFMTGRQARDAGKMMTASSFDAFRTISFTDNPNVAADYTEFQRRRAASFAPTGVDTGFTGESIIPVYVRGNFMEVDYGGKPFDPDIVEEHVLKAEKDGFDGVRLNNIIDHVLDQSSFSDEELTGTTTLVFDPKNIRSVHAQFEQDDTPDLLARREPPQTLSPEGRAAWQMLEDPNVDIDEINKLPIIVKAVQEMEAIDPVQNQPGFGTEEWENSRKFDFDGEQVVGYTDAYHRFYDDAQTLASRELGVESYKVEKGRRATIVIGPPAAGKSTIANGLAFIEKAAIADNDEVKKTLPEYANGVGAAAVHVESGDIMDDITDIMIAEGLNLVIPKIGHNPVSIRALTDVLHRNGYKVHLAWMNVDWKTAYIRMLRRFLTTGRIIDPVYAMDAGKKPGSTYKTLQDEGVADAYTEVLSNEGDAPKIAGTTGENFGISSGQTLTVGEAGGLRRAGAGRQGQGPAGADLAAQRSGRVRARQAVGERVRPDQGISEADGAEADGDLSISKMSRNLDKMLDLTVRLGRLTIRGSDVLGQYQRSTSEIRLKSGDDLSTRVHEAAHALHDNKSRILNKFVVDHQQQIDEIADKWYGGDFANQAVREREGFAEFFRVYVLSRGFGTVQGRSTYIDGLDQMNADFDQLLNQTDPRLKQGLDLLKDQFDTWLRIPSTAAINSMVTSGVRKGVIGTALEEIRDRDIEGSVGFRSTGSWLEDKWRSLYSQAIDSGDTLRRVVDGLLTESEKNNNGVAVDLAHHENPYVLWTLNKHNMGAALIQMKYGIRGYRSTQAMSPALRDGIQVAMGEQPGTRGRTVFNQKRLSDFNDYLIARRARAEFERYHQHEIPRPPLGENVTEGDVDQAISDLETKWGQSFIDGADIVYEYSRAMWQKIHDAGLIDDELYQLGVDKIDYVPLMRDMSDRGKVFGQSFLTSGEGKIVKRFKGSGRNIIAPLDSIMQQTFAYEKLIAANEVRLALVKLGQKVGPGSGKYVVQVPAHDLVGQNINVLETMKKALKDPNIDPVDAAAMYKGLESSFDETATVTLFRATETTPAGEHIVFYYENGKKKAAQVADGEVGEDLMMLMSAVGKENLPLGMDMVAFTSNAFRAGITMWPDFIAVNFFRDQLQTWLQQTEYTPFVTGLGGLRDEVGQKSAAQDYNALGGIMGGMLVASAHDAQVKRDIRALERKGYRAEVVGDVGQIVKGNVASLVNGLGRVTEVSESATRIGLFKKAQAKYMADGLSEYEAGIAAAYISVDNMNFSRSGSRTLAIRRLITFFNAQLQGLDKMWRVLSAADAGRRRKGLSWKMAMSIAFKDMNGMDLNKQEMQNLKISRAAWRKMMILSLIYMAIAAINEDDPDYQAASPYLKATGAWIPMGEGKGFWLPKPFEWAVLGNFLESAYGKHTGDGRAMERFKEGLFHMMVPPTDVPIFNTTRELLTNVDTFRQQPIVPFWLERFDAHEQYNAYTSEVAKSIGKAMGWSPMKVDHFIKNMFASAGRDFLAETNNVFGENRPEMGAEDHFFTRRWIRDSKRGSTIARDFWDHMSFTDGKLTRASATYKKMRDDGRSQDAQDFLSRMTQDEQVFALLNYDRKAAEKRLHPMRHANDYNGVIGKMRREIISGDGLQDTSFSDDTPEIIMTARTKALVEDLLAEMNLRTQRNVLVLMEDPGWHHRKMLPTEESFDLLAEIQPVVADELERRLDDARVYRWDHVRDTWPELKERLLLGGEEEVLRDLVVGAKR